MDVKGDIKAQWFTFELKYPGSKLEPARIADVP